MNPVDRLQPGSMGGGNSAGESAAAYSEQERMRSRMSRQLRSNLSHITEMSGGPNGLTIGHETPNRSRRPSMSERSRRLSGSFQHPAHPPMMRPVLDPNLQHGLRLPGGPMPFPRDTYSPDSESEPSSNLSENTDATSVLDMSDGNQSKPPAERRVVRMRPSVRKGALHNGRPNRPMLRTRVSAPSSRRSVQIEVQQQKAPPSPRPAPAPAPTPAPAPQLVVQGPDPKIYKLEIEQLRRETHALQQTRATSVRQLDEALSRLSTLLIDKEEAEKQRDQEKVWREEMRKELDERGKVVEQVTGQLKEMEEMLSELTKQRDEAQAEKNDLEAKCSDLEMEIQKAPHMQPAHGDLLVERIASLEVVKESLQSQVESIEGQRAAREQDVANLTQERDELQEELGKRESDLKSMEEEKSAIQEKLNGVEEESNELRVKVEGLEADKAAGEAQIAVLSAERDGLKAKGEEQEAEIGKLKEDLGTTRAELDKLKEEMSEEGIETREELRTARDELQKQNEGLQEDVNKITEEKTTLEAAKTELEAAKEELEKEVAEIPELRSQNETLEAQLGDANERIDELNASCESGQAEAAGLREQVAQLRSRPKSRSVSSSKRNKSRVRQEDLVVVRSPGDRTSLQIVKKKHLRSPSSASQRSEDSD